MAFDCKYYDGKGYCLGTREVDPCIYPNCDNYKDVSYNRGHRFNHSIIEDSTFLVDEKTLADVLKSFMIKNKNI